MKLKAVEILTGSDLMQKKEKQRLVCLTGRAALTEQLVSALSAVLAQQLVVAHQQLHRGELVEAGLDRALLRAGRVAVRQGLERPLVVLLVKVVPWHLALFGGVVRRQRWRGAGGVTSRQAHVDPGNRRRQLFYSTTLTGG